jgi:hypothetical protein
VLFSTILSTVLEVSPDLLVESVSVFVTVLSGDLTVVLDAIVNAKSLLAVEEQ